MNNHVESPKDDYEDFLKMTINVIILLNPCTQTMKLYDSLLKEMIFKLKPLIAKI